MATRAKAVAEEKFVDVAGEPWVSGVSIGVMYAAEAFVLSIARSTVPETPSTEPDFAQLTIDLAAADARARSSAADAGAARAERSTVAVGAIKAAFREKLDYGDVRADLLRAGVLKGTVSKIITVLEALNKKIIYPGDVKSLNGAYNAVKAASLVAATSGSAGPVGVPFAAPVIPVVATTPDEAMKIIIDSIKSVSDPDQAFKLAGEWITRITNEITSALSTIDDEESE